MAATDRVRAYDKLYDNPLVQDYVNRVGHSVVPKDSTRLYAFRVMLNPVPEARSLSTGTIYVSTGLLSLIDNEAQLAYILGHEIAHVEKDHWRDDVLVLKGMDRWNEKQQKKRSIIGAVATAGSDDTRPARPTMASTWPSPSTSPVVTLSAFVLGLKVATSGAPKPPAASG